MTQYRFTMRRENGLWVSRIIDVYDFSVAGGGLTPKAAYAQMWHAFRLNARNERQS